LDQVVSHPPEGLDGVIDAERAGAIGYSFDGYNALALSGAREELAWYFTEEFVAQPSIPLGGIGLVCTASDYLRFAQMLLNGGELDGVRLLGRKTVQYMIRNHLPQELLPTQIAPGWELPGCGYGLEFWVAMDAVQFWGQPYFARSCSAPSGPLPGTGAGVRAGL